MMGDIDHASTHADQVVIGGDTRRDEHVAVDIDRQCVRLCECPVPATTCGYRELERWFRSLGEICAFRIEGAGAARFMVARGYAVVEVNPPDRSVRYLKGRSDTTDAEVAARAVLAGTVLAEQHDEWAVGRRYLTPEVATKREALPEVSLTQSTAARVVQSG